MKMENFKMPPKKEEKDKDTNHVVVERLARFDTDGWDEYPKEKFLKYVKENNIDTSIVLDNYLDNIDPNNKFSEEEFKYIKAFRAWLHSDFEKAQKYIDDKFNFECKDNNSFIKKYQFFNTVAVFMFENKDIWRETDIIKEEKYIFESLKNSYLKDRGSFLLNYLARDYISVINGEKYSVQNEDHFEDKPFQITSNQYAFDSSLSFAGVYKNNFKNHELCVSYEKDFEKVSEIIKSLDKDFLQMGQDKFDELAQYFYVLEPKDIVLTKQESADKTELFLFKELNSKYHRINLKEQTGIDISKISLTEQKYFINYLKFIDGPSLDRVKLFNEKYNKDGLRTFLSTEQEGREMGDKILTLGEKLPEEVAEKVFVKYGEIINAADRAEEEVRKMYEKDNIPGEVFQSIKEILLKRGAGLLSGLADRLNDSNKINEEDVFNTLEDIKTSTIIIGESYIELYKQGIKVPIEEIKDTTLEKISADNLSEKEKQELVKVYENGRPKETYENKEHLKLLTEEFKQTLENKDTFVFNIRLGGEIIAFATFYKENEDTLHIGGLTFIDDVRNPVVGEAVMNSIMKEFSNFNIKALVHSENKILKMYQKRFGFKITKELPCEENAGELYYEIERMKDGGKDLIQKNIAA